MQIKRLSTNSPIDKILDGGLEHGAITNIYGPASAGKTNIALLSLLNCKNKVIYVDTEGSFSVERFAQLGGDEKKLKNIIFFEPHSWNDQSQCLMKLEKLLEKEKIDIIIVDSMVALYRLEMTEKNFKDTNRELAWQYSLLSKLSRKYNIPILITNQVYSKEDGDIELTSKTIARYWSKCLVEIQRSPKSSVRKAILQKHRSLPDGKSVEFEITSKGFREVKFGIF